MIVPVNQNIWNRNIFTGHTQDALSVCGGGCGCLCVHFSSYLGFRGN